MRIIVAISVRIYKGAAVLDLDYPEDSDCDYRHERGDRRRRHRRIQEHRRGEPFTRSQMDALVDLAANGIGQLISAQRLR